jgi:hypothetical protein
VVRWANNGTTITNAIPSISRWLSRDPLGEYAGINIYGYVLNDPVNGIDPFGLCGGAGTGPSYDQAVGMAYQQNGLSNIGDAINTYNQLARILADSTTRALWGALNITTGIFNMTTGGGAIVVGATASVLPLPFGLGQLTGPPAFGLGIAEFTYGQHKLRTGIVNLNAGLNGNGFPPLPQYQVQGVGSGTVVVGQACKAP